MLDDGIATTTLIPEKLIQSGGYRYMQARRPELFRDIIGKAHKSELKVAWL
jgi:hypothetical protein